MRIERGVIMTKTEVTEIKNRIKKLLSSYKIVDWEFWECMGDIMVKVVFIRQHVVKRVTFSIRSYDGRLDMIGGVDIF